MCTIAESQVASLHWLPPRSLQYIVFPPHWPFAGTVYFPVLLPEFAEVVLAATFVGVAVPEARYKSYKFTIYHIWCQLMKLGVIVFARCAMNEDRWPQWSLFLNSWTKGGDHSLPRLESHAMECQLEIFYSQSRSDVAAVQTDKTSRNWSMLGDSQLYTLKDIQTCSAVDMAQSQVDTREEHDHRWKNKSLNTACCLYCDCEWITGRDGYQ